MFYTSNKQECHNGAGSQRDSEISTKILSFPKAGELTAEARHFFQRSCCVSESCPSCLNIPRGFGQKRGTVSRRHIFSIFLYTTASGGNFGCRKPQCPTILVPRDIAVDDLRAGRGKMGQQTCKLSLIVYSCQHFMSYAEHISTQIQSRYNICSSIIYRAIPLAFM